MTNPQSRPRSQQIKPAHVLIICLCVVAALFAGSIFVGWAAWQADKSAAGVVRTDQPG